MNTKLYFWIMLVVIAALFTNQVAADLAGSQQAYDEAVKQYNELREKYNTAIEKYNSVSMSGDLTQMENLQYDFWNIQSTAKHFVNYCLFYATPLHNSLDQQEQALGKEFTARGHMFVQLQDDSSAKINNLELIKLPLQLQQNYQTLVGQMNTEKKTLVSTYHEIGNIVAVSGNGVKALELKKTLEMWETAWKTLRTAAMNDNHKTVAIKDTVLQKKLAGLVSEMDAELKTIAEVKANLDNYIVQNTNNNPVLVSIGSKSVTVGGTLSFTVSAMDADNDTLTFALENKPTNAQFENKVFSWTPTASEAGIYTVTFKVMDAKGGEAKEAVMITVSASAPLSKLQEAQQKFNNYQDKYESYKDDYVSYKKKYDTAVHNNEYSDVKKYNKELDGLDDELNDLGDDLDYLKDEADSLTDGDALYDDVKDLQKDVEALRTKIKNVLDGETTPKNTTQNGATSTVKPVVSEKQVEVQMLSTMPGSILTNDNVRTQGDDDFRAKILLIGGIGILSAVIVFLIAMMLF